MVMKDKNQLETKLFSRSSRASTALACLPLAFTACTGQLSDSFRYTQQKESYGLTQEINTKIDMLWVVDNSASMDVSQQKIRDAFTAFANKYMQPTWDIRVAVITTDTYLAHPSYQHFLNRTIGGTASYNSAYAAGRATYPNPSWAPDLFNTGTDRFRAGGLKFWELVPAWTAYGSADPTVTFARLLPGLHDGPVAALCVEDFPTRHFFGGTPNCRTRDDTGANTGAERCLRPQGAETSVTQCVNTVLNDTVRSGEAIIETLGANAVTLNDAFRVNATAGSAGHGSERGFQSVLELLSQNESTATALFRADSTRMIVFVSDEDDQTQSTPPAGEQTTHTPWSYYKCDGATLNALNPAAGLTNPGSVCCAGGSCSYGTQGTSCTAKTYPGEGTRTVTICPVDAKLIAVTGDGSSVKDQLDTFFQTLDGSGSTGNPNYSVAAIVPKTLASVNALQALRNTEDSNVGLYVQNSVDRGDRYMELSTAVVGSGSLNMEINSNDYTPLLDAIGTALVANKSKFTLEREPTAADNMIVQIIRSGGGRDTLTTTQYSISGKILTITDYDVVLSFQQGDSLYVDYQPANLN